MSNVVGSLFTLLYFCLFFLPVNVKAVRTPYKITYRIPSLVLTNNMMIYSMTTMLTMSTLLSGSLRVTMHIHIICFKVRELYIQRDYNIHYIYSVCTLRILQFLKKCSLRGPSLHQWYNITYSMTTMFTKFTVYCLAKYVKVCSLRITLHVFIICI